MNVLTVGTFEDAKEIYRHKDFKQALYDAGEVVMDGVLVNLHGDEHRARRRLENRLFRRETLVHYERDLFPKVIEETLAPHVADGHGELVELSHQLMMNLAALNAGVDRPLRTKAETENLYAFMMKFIEGATLAHTTRDPQEVTREVEGAKQEFNRQFLVPSIRRRQDLLERAKSDQSVELPKDILTELLRNEDSLPLPDEIILKEIAFFLLAGAHTSATAFVRTIDNLFTWLEKHPEDRELLRSDKSFVQRAVFETIRLNPSSPIAMRRATTDITLKSGTVVPKDSLVTVDLMSVNRDPDVFGGTAAEFNPHARSTSQTLPRGGCPSATECTPASAKNSLLGCRNAPSKPQSSNTDSPRWQSRRCLTATWPLIQVSLLGWTRPRSARTGARITFVLVIDQSRGG